MKRSFLCFVLITAIVSACSGNVAPTIVETSAPRAEPTALGPKSPTPEASLEAATPAPTPEPQKPAFTRYTFNVVLDYDSRQANVDQEVAYFNNTDGLLEELLLVVEPNRFPGAFTLDQITWENGEPVVDYSLEGDKLAIALNEPLTPGSEIVFLLSYQLNIPQQNAPFGFTERQINFGDWYPFVPPYLPEEGWLVREAAYLGEHLAYDVADFQVAIQLASQTSAEGRAVVIAASAPAEQNDGKYLYRLHAARSFAWSVSDQYQVMTTTVADVEVLSYAFPFHPAAEEPVLTATADALALFTTLYGPYAHGSLSVVEADFLNGMEYEGLIFLSHAFYDYFTGTPENNLIIIAAHEVAHQWFYGWVGNDQAMEPWLDEATSTYSEMFFYKNVHPDLLNWWWDNRINFHEPEGWVDATIYDAPGFYPYRDAIYLRGVLFLDEIKELIGEEAFLEFLRDYLHTFRYKIASGDDFFGMLQEYTTEDLEPIVEKYFANRQISEQ